MPYTVSVERKAGKFLRSLTDRRLYHRLSKAIEGLADDQHPPGSVKLQGEDDLYRIRVGDYRIVYEIQDAVLVVLVVQLGHRREIYRR